jgi:hypothetical protein
MQLLIENDMKRKLALRQYSDVQGHSLLDIIAFVSCREVHNNAEISSLNTLLLLMSDCATFHSAFKLGRGGLLNNSNCRGPFGTCAGTRIELDDISI